MKNVIARISEGLGNQLFMYANAYSFSKKLGYNLYVDSKSGYKRLKIRNFLLDNFNIDIKYADKSDFNSNILNYIKLKIDKKIDIFRSKKKFLIEKKFENKSTKFLDYTKFYYSDKVFLEGNFESELFFKDYKNEIKNLFQLKRINQNTLSINPSQILNGNSVSIVVRQHRFSEKSSKIEHREKSDLFVKNTLDYIYLAIKFIRTKINNPKFYIFSNDTNNLKNYFYHDNFKIINHIDNKPINDFYLSTLCKHFIVGPSTFHWWSAYLSKNQTKICIRPTEKIKFSSNINIYPKEWITI